MSDIPIEVQLGFNEYWKRERYCILCECLLEEKGRFDIIQDGDEFYQKVACYCNKCELSVEFKKGIVKTTSNHNEKSNQSYTKEEK